MQSSVTFETVYSEHWADRAGCGGGRRAAAELRREGGKKKEKKKALRKKKKKKKKGTRKAVRERMMVHTNVDTCHLSISNILEQHILDSENIGEGGRGTKKTASLQPGRLTVIELS